MLEVDGTPRKELNQEVFLEGLGEYVRRFLLRKAFETEFGKGNAETELRNFLDTINEQI